MKCEVDQLSRLLSCWCFFWVTEVVYWVTEVVFFESLKTFFESLKLFIIHRSRLLSHWVILLCHRVIYCVTIVVYWVTEVVFWVTEVVYWATEAEVSDFRICAFLCKLNENCVVVQLVVSGRTIFLLLTESYFWLIALIRSDYLRPSRNCM